MYLVFVQLPKTKVHVEALSPINGGTKPDRKAGGGGLAIPGAHASTQVADDPVAIRLPSVGEPAIVHQQRPTLGEALAEGKRLEERETWISVALAGECGAHLAHKYILLCELAMKDPDDAQLRSVNLLHLHKQRVQVQIATTVTDYE